MILPVTDNNGNPTDEHWIVFHGVDNNEFHIYKMDVNGSMTFVRKVSGGPVVTAAKCSESKGDFAVMLKANGCYNQFVMNYGSEVSLFDFDSENNILFSSLKFLSCSFK